MSMTLEKEWKSAVAIGEDDSWGLLCRTTEGWEEKPLWVETWKMGCASAEIAIIISLVDPEAWYMPKDSGKVDSEDILGDGRGEDGLVGRN